MSVVWDSVVIHFSRFADAAFVRTRGTVRSAIRLISPDRTFNLVKTGRIQTDLSLRSVRTGKARDRAAINELIRIADFRNTLV